MADTATITVGGGNSASITVQQQAVLSAVIPDASASVSLDVASSSSPSFDIAVPAVSFDISSSTAFVATVKEQFNTITVSSAIPAVGTTRLRDLEDVKGDPTSGQILVYNLGENNFQFQDQNTGGAGGDDLTDEAITVTNTDGGFSSLVGGTFETGTSITTILKNILDPYKIPEFTSFNMTGDSAGNSFSLSSGSSQSVEVGSTVSPSFFEFVLSDNSNIQGSSVSFQKNSVDYQSVSSSSSGLIGISPSISDTISTPSSISYRLKAVETGNPNGISTTVLSNSITFNWRYKTLLCASSTIPSSNAEASSLLGGVMDFSLAADPGSGSISLTCSSSSETETNHSFLLIPEPFGTLKSVVQNSSFDVTADFVQVTSSTFTVTTATGISVAYYIYRTNDPGAFNNGNTLTISFN
jgi:hypothetical protein